MNKFLTVCVLLAFASFTHAEDHPAVVEVKSKVKDVSKPFTMMVMFKIKEGKNEEFEKVTAISAAGTQKEKGNIAYFLSQDLEDPSKYVLYERWKNVEALAEHLKLDHTKQMLDKLPDVLDGKFELKIMNATGTP